jgi:L-arabinose isomerase
MKKGPVTLLACSQDGDGNFKMICAEGECVPGPVLRLGDTNSRIRFSMGMRKFINEWCRQGPTHHFVMALGHHTGAIEKAARLLGCGFKNLV